MTDGRAVYDPNRLPWLTDERAPPRRRRKPTDWNLVLPWALLAAVLVAGVAYWAGMRSAAVDGIAVENPMPSSPEAVPPAPRAEPAPAPAVRPAPAPAVEAPAPVRTPEAEPLPAPKAQARPRDQLRTLPRAKAAKPAVSKPSKKRKSAAPKASSTSVQRSAKLTAWPADVSEGAAGRVVRIGTFSTRRQAKRAWWRIVKVYPGMKRLKAVVAPVPSVRNGRTYYRLQFGTTSQAHSTVLCQRMRIVGQSCTVVGL